MYYDVIYQAQVVGSFTQKEHADSYADRSDEEMRVLEYWVLEREGDLPLNGFIVLEDHFPVAAFQTRMGGDREAEHLADIHPDSDCYVFTAAEYANVRPVN